MDISFDKFDLTVGFFVFIGLIAIACLTAFLVNPDLFDIGGVQVKTYLPSTYSLKRGVPVTYLEMPVGHVKSVQLFKPEHPRYKVEVLFTIKSKFKNVIRKDFRTSLEERTLGGIISGNIILNPPDNGESLMDPVENGDVLLYHKSTFLLGDVTTILTQVQETLLPKADSILTELNKTLARLNDPNGDLLPMLSASREITELLADPDGEFRDTLKRVNSLATTMADEKNLFMKMIHNDKLLETMNETMNNFNQVSRSGVEITDSAGDSLQTILPKVEKVLMNFIEIQAQMDALLKDAQEIASTVMYATQGLPTMMGDMEYQLREMEDITRAVKNISIIQWNLEDESIGDPLIRKPLLLRRFNEEIPVQD